MSHFRAPNLPSEEKQQLEGQAGVFKLGHATLLFNLGIGRRTQFTQAGLRLLAAEEQVIHPPNLGQLQNPGATPPRP